MACGREVEKLFQRQSFRSESLPATLGHVVNLYHRIDRTVDLDLLRTDMEEQCRKP